ncbi:MAG: hypothetical protein NVS3B2_16110 [Ramlibacter sp.]
MLLIRVIAGSLWRASDGAARQLYAIERAAGSNNIVVNLTGALSVQQVVEAAEMAKKAESLREQG